MPSTAGSVGIPVSSGQGGCQHWPALVGIGSVCRRNVSGRDGIASIVDALDTAPPKHVRFHLFGV